MSSPLWVCFDCSGVPPVLCMYMYIHKYVHAYVCAYSMWALYMWWLEMVSPVTLTCAGCGTYVAVKERGGRGREGGWMGGSLCYTICTWQGVMTVAH